MDKSTNSMSATNQDTTRRDERNRDTKSEGDFSTQSHSIIKGREAANTIQDASASSSNAAANLSIPNEDIQSDISRQTTKLRDASRDVETQNDILGHAAIERDAPRRDVEDRDMPATSPLGIQKDQKNNTAANTETSFPVSHYVETTNVPSQTHSNMFASVEQQTSQRTEINNNASVEPNKNIEQVSLPTAEDQKLKEVNNRQEDAPTNPAPQENWLDIEQAAKMLREHGISRTGRTIQRLCKKGDLEARLVPTENASRYIINENSVKALIKRYNETLPSMNASSEGDESDNLDTLKSNASNERVSPTHKVAPNNQASFFATEQPTIETTHMQQIVDLKDQQINMLQSQLTTANNQIAVKDEQINTMLERDHETNVLIQNLQQLVALPEGRSKPTDWRSSI